MVSLKETFGYSCTIGTQIVVNNYNYKTIREFVGFVTKTIPGIDYIQVRPLEVLPSENPYSLDMLNEIKPQLNQVRINKKVIVSKKWDLFWDNPKREYGYTACHCAEFIGVIDAYGDAYLCCHTVKNPNYKYCNVFKLKQKENFFLKRIDKLKELGESKGLNPRVCPLQCRGSNLNRRLEGLKNEPEHENFL
jgi:sulfatase maturation enzyme AslB (radical SAM superfamily)